MEGKVNILKSKFIALGLLLTLGVSVSARDMQETLNKARSIRREENELGALGVVIGREKRTAKKEREEKAKEREKERAEKKAKEKSVKNTKIKKLKK